jgi:asparagine synthase (glutamine-hydrolysing)
MCGICGFLGFEDKHLLNRMCSVIRHRGPDDHGIYIDRNVCLGSRRLSVIDLVGGKQPIHNEDESVWIVYNGEIYNFKSIKKDLEGKHKFYTNTDTEVILHAYEEYGMSCIKKFNGMFAFAIWDSNKKRLFLARDRLGVKPLYYAFVEKKFLFASEIKAILEYPIERRVDYNALQDFLTFRIAIDDRTMFSGIKKLLPGHMMIYEKGRFVIRKYWDLKMKALEIDEKKCIEEVKRILKDSVRLRLISDVPLGVYLSGGIDSSIVTGLMNQLESNVKTFSVGFGEKEDEVKYARIVSEHFSTDHHEIIVEPDTMKLLPKIVWHMDEPMADPATIPTYILSEFAKKKCTVVLTGEGGDEEFGGYEQYKFMLLSQFYEKHLSKITGRKMPSLIVRASPKKILNSFFSYTSSLGKEGMNRFSKFILSKSLGEKYLNIVSIFSEEEKKELCKASPKTNLIKRINKYFQTSDLLNEMIYLDHKTSLPNNLLMKVDKMAMAFSVEARVPFLDYLLVEYAATIPSNLKIRFLKEKYILRKIAKDFLPKIITRRKKQRFFVPIDRWIERDAIAKILSEENIREGGYFNYNYIVKIMEGFDESKLYYSRQLWNLLTFEIWHKIFIEREKVSSMNKLYGL